MKENLNELREINEDNFARDMINLLIEASVLSKNTVSLLKLIEECKCLRSQLFPRALTFAGY